jgi:CTP synthase (UTP-ammonia lyase)
MFETKKIKSNILNTYLDYINSFISYSKSKADFHLKTYSATTCYTHLDYIETYSQFQTYSNKIEERDINDLAAVGVGEEAAVCRLHRQWRSGSGTTVGEDGHTRW